MDGDVPEHMVSAGVRWGVRKGEGEILTLCLPARKKRKNLPCWCL